MWTCLGVLSFCLQQNDILFSFIFTALAQYLADSGNTGNAFLLIDPWIMIWHTPYSSVLLNGITIHPGPK